MEQVGTLRMLWRYPVKSMAGEQLDTAPLTFQGIPGDREYTFVLAESKSVFPWLTGRSLPGMLQYRARYAKGEQPPVTVVRPGGDEVLIDTPELLAELQEGAGKPIYLLRNYRGTQDVAPISVMNLATARGIAEAAGTEPDPLRFRMNLYIETGSDEPFAENRWLGRQLAIGDARIAVMEPDSRCMMITLDHSSSQGSPEILKAVARLNNNGAGVYGAIVAEGEVRTDDPVYVL